MAGLEVALSRMQFPGFLPLIGIAQKEKEGEWDKREITHSTKREQREGKGEWAQEAKSAWLKDESLLAEY